MSKSTMRNKVKIKIPPSRHYNLSPSTILFCCVVWLQLLNGLPVLCGSEGVFVSNPYQAMSPEMYRFLQQQQRTHISNSKMKPNDPHIQRESGINEKTDSLGELHKVTDNLGKGITPDTESGAYAEQQQLQQLLPVGFLLPKQFPKSANAMIFNQANGAFVDPSEEAETNGHLGLLPTYNDYDLLPTKQVVVRSGSYRPGHFPVNLSGPPVKRSQSLAAAREGYMCHFKLCQFGSSGKRRWSPLFEFD